MSGQGDDAGDAGDSEPVTRGELRSILKEELAGLLPKVEGGDGDGGQGGDDAGDDGGDDDAGDGEPLTLREITNRALRLTSAALDKIPGTPAKAAEPAAPVTQKPPIPRGLKVLGFADPEG